MVWEMNFNKNVDHMEAFKVFCQMHTLKNEPKNAESTFEEHIELVDQRLNQSATRHVRLFNSCIGRSQFRLVSTTSTLYMLPCQLNLSEHRGI